MNALTGKWDLVVHTFMGDQFSFHDLDAENGLTGTVTDKGNGSKVDIYETSMDGNKFTYKFKIKIPIGEMEFTVNGELTADGTLKGRSSNAMGDFEFDAKKIS